MSEAQAVTTTVDAHTAAETRAAVRRREAPTAQGHVVAAPGRRHRQ